MRGAGLETDRETPSPPIEPKDGPTPEPENEVYWWLKYHGLHDYYNPYFKGIAHRLISHCFL